MMMPTVFLVILASTADLGTAAGQGEPPATTAKAGSELRKEVRVPTNLGFATSVSADGQAATLIFDNLYVAVEPASKGAAGTSGQTAAATKVVTFEIPYSTDRPSLKMYLDLRGFLSADAGANVRLVACAGDTTKVVDISTGQDDPVQFKGKSKEAITAGRDGAKFGDFFDRIEFTVQPRAAKPVRQVTLLLVADHDTDSPGSGGALLAVDSLDLSVSKSEKGTANP
jgi:hypothetical protein